METLSSSAASASATAGAVRPALERDIPLDLTERLRALRNALAADLVERDVAIRLALLAALAGEHLLLVGPPGTAKSVLARRLHLAFKDASYFERLLTKFSVPEELFGPLSIKGLEEDRYERQTDRYLPTASVAFLDEIFKANSAILNALLTLLNEREFDNGAKRVRTPLVSVVGASNELAEGEELDALFDRFLLRLHVGPVSAQGFRSLLALRGDAPPEIGEAVRLGTDDLAAIQAAAVKVVVPDDVVALLAELREWCAAEGIPVSDRRWRKVVKLLQVSALTNGRTSASVWDAWLLQHCLWSDPEDTKKIYDWYAARVGASAAMAPSQLTRIVVSWEGKLAADQGSRSQMRDEQGRLLYRGSDGRPTPNTKGKEQGKRGAEPLFLAPANSYDGRHSQVTDRTNGGKGYTKSELDELHLQNPYHYGSNTFRHWKDRDTYLANQNNWLILEVERVPLMEPTRHKPAYVNACLREIEEIHAQVVAYQAHLAAHVASMQQEIRSHLWVTPDFAGPAGESLAATAREVAVLLARVEDIRKGFVLLPREGETASNAIKTATK